MKFYDTEQMKNLPAPEWILDKVIQRNSTALLFGPSGAGKSFIALEVAFALAAQDNTIFDPSAKGVIIYIVAEGLSGFGVRIKAWERARKHKLNGESNLWFYGDALQIAQPKELSTFIGAINEEFGDERILMVVVDTVARAAVGLDENSAKDMGLFVDGMETIRKAFDCTVLVVHHSTKSAPDKERGSGALYAAVDTAISVKEVNSKIIFQCRKQKNSEPFAKMQLKLSSDGESCSIQRVVPKVELGGKPKKLKIEGDEVIVPFGEWFFI